jgi:putative solute:sodium symporter small subunit
VISARRLGWFLLAVAAWNVVTWVMFARNLYDAHADGEDRPTGYWVAHTGLIVVNLALAVVFALLARRLLRSRDSV